MAGNLIAGAAGVHDGKAMTLKPDSFFSSLRRPASPNHWLVAPADFAVRPDAAAPVFAVPASVLRQTLKTVMLRAQGTAVAAESADSLHVVVTTPVFRFRDDVRVQFIPVAPQQSSFALYSASRIGYWDLGANRRRLEDWVEQTRRALESRNR
jgi:uncharacterized protein (DUF1499 family)